LRPFTTYKNIKTGQLCEIDSWPEVDWFLQNEPAVRYLWNGFNHSEDLTHYEGERIRYEGSFAPNPFSRVPSDIDLDSGWHFINDPVPYKSLAWSYSKARLAKKDLGEFYRPDDEVVVNGIRVQAAGPSLRLPKSNDFTMPSYYIFRPSLSISDPAGLCPINLQRSAVAFDRMGIDERLAKSILGDIFSRLKNEAINHLTINNFYRAVLFLTSQPGLGFPGQLSPICICTKGVFLSSGQNLSSLGIDTIYFIDANSQQVDIPIGELISDNEAIILRRETDSGTQSALSWFRGIFSSEASLFYSHARTIGVPNVIPVIQMGILQNKRWNIANEKGRVGKSILNGLDCEKYDAKSTFVRSKGLEFDELRAKIGVLHKRLSPLNEVCVWNFHIGESDPQAQSIISDVWEDVFLGLLGN
jgi:hypothetical protein